MTVEIISNAALLLRERARRYAENGARWLDGEHPNWEQHVDIDVLDIASGSRDVLGQIAEWASDGDGSDYDWFIEEGPHADFLGEDVETPCGDEDCEEEDCDSIIRRFYFGFDSSSGATYSQLTEAWQELLRDRRQG